MQATVVPLGSFFNVLQILGMGCKAVGFSLEHIEERILEVLCTSCGKLKGVAKLPQHRKGGLKLELKNCWAVAAPEHGTPA